MKLKRGPIYITFDRLMEAVAYLNIVELFKYIAAKLYEQLSHGNEAYVAKRIAVDVFIICKFALVVTAIVLRKNSVLWEVAIWYLIAANLYTYFYYHLWSTRILKDKKYSVHRLKRRFLNLAFAVFFSVVAYGYLYLVPFASEFTWSTGFPSISHAMLFSLANTFSASISLVGNASTLGEVLVLSQVGCSFVFLAILLSNSTPQSGS